MAHLKVDDEVCFLSFNKMYTGNISAFSDILVLVKEHSTEEIMKVTFPYILPIETKFCVVQSDAYFHPNRKIRFDRTTYPVQNRTYDKWIDEAAWIQEVFDPVQLRLIATKYGLVL